MAYENSAGIGVSNQYGQRVAGGEEGVYKTFGFDDQYILDLDGPKPFPYKFPIRNNVKVVGFNAKFVTGTVTALTIGGVSVFTATEAAPVSLAASNTGIVVQTGGTGGKLVIRYENVAGDDFTWEETDV